MKVYANEIKVTAAEMLQKMGAPLPGLPRHRQVPPQGVPRMNFGEPAQEPGMEGEDELNGAPQDGANGNGDGNGKQPGQKDLLTTVKRLQDTYFTDDKVNDISDSLMAIIPMVGPAHTEKITKVYTKWMEAVALLKANLGSLVVMAQPINQMQEQVQNIMNAPDEMGGGGPQQEGLKIGPLT